MHLKTGSKYGPWMLICISVSLVVRFALLAGRVWRIGELLKEGYRLFTEH